MHFQKRFTLTGALLSILVLGPIAAQAEEASAPARNPLAPFGRMIGGRWTLGESYQTFEWGVGKRSVRARGFFVVEGKAKLVSEGMWFWHPESQQIKGYFTAIDMGVEFFEYTTAFEGDLMTNDLKSYGADGAAQSYIETWAFSGDAQYEWTLSTRSEKGLEKVMGGTYERK